ncbi:ATP-grasp domain-containing protein [Pseudodesulfovibrio senegalensis]|uniref:ATP-grasp domain-containing protein n=1 Tax=Pseudodesulfovibrio senegalensis TaxID=1721087 RepID=A0A6N6N3Q5_9BACT|nr:ATP-grasp domain-containing protein [Pseudodesulfovibrio senegalensis]KAB1441713.1 ATP-grasp domain-containing protein [Pseudodesulfovibrio senegalensis]
MIILDAPYVSDFLKESIQRQNIPVLDTEQARALAGGDLKYVPAQEFAPVNGRVYTNSENALEAVSRLLGHTDIPRQVEACKDKVRFRELTAPLFPDYFFCRATLEELEAMDPARLSFPLVVKPARGFFSLGVHMVEKAAGWPHAIAALREEIADFNANYPADVVDSGSFIVEQAAAGEEYAVDVYWDHDGNAVVLNVLHHIFSSGDDVSDRLYLTSADILNEHLERFSALMQDIGQACGFRDFPAHIELRLDEQGSIIPIEANPLRFAGWCVADMTRMAWGFDPYEYYLNDLRPDWQAILPEREGRIFSMCVADLPASVDRQAITEVDWDGVADLFEDVLELRKIDYREFPVLAFVFAATSRENTMMLDAALRADFARFVK